MKDRATTAILAIFLGAYGVHHFYMGNNSKGVKYLLITLLTFGIGATVMSIISIIDAVHYLGLTDEQFQAEIENIHTMANQKDEGKKASAKTTATATENRLQQYEELKQAKELLDTGVITEQDFFAIKIKLLGD